MENFGQRVIDLREKQGWTRRELAKRSGLHEQHLLKIEQGLRKRIEGGVPRKAGQVAVDCVL